MLLLQRVEQDCECNDWLVACGVFSSLDVIREKISGEGAEIIEHVEPRGFDNGRIAVKRSHASYWPPADIWKYEYCEVTLDKYMD